MTINSFSLSIKKNIISVKLVIEMKHTIIDIARSTKKKDLCNMQNTFPLKNVYSGVEENKSLRYFKIN